MKPTQPHLSEVFTVPPASTREHSDQGQQRLIQVLVVVKAVLVGAGGGIEFY